MEEGETVSMLSRKELRKQKLMEYLAAKGKMKLPNPKPYLHDNSLSKEPVTSALKAVKGKENKGPTQRFRCEIPKVQSLAAQSTKHPARMFGVTNKVNIKESILAGQENECRLSVTSGPEQQKLNQNLSVSAKSNLNTAAHLKKKPNAGVQVSVKASSNAVRTGVTTSNSRSSSSTIAAWSGAVKTVNGRISLGPIVKTKTGLIPAVIQPRNTNSQIKHTSATAADTITATTYAAKKTISSTSSSVCVSQRSAMAQRRTFPATVVNKPINEKTTVSSTARFRKVQDQDKTNSKPLLVKHSQPSCKIQVPSGLKSTSMSFKSKVAPFKAEDKKGMSKTSQSAGQLTDRSTKQRSEGRGETNNQPYKVASQASLGPLKMGTLRTVSGTVQPAVAELAGKTMKCKETQCAKKQTSVKVPPQQTVVKRAGVAKMSHTVPQPARTVSFTGKATERKTPNVLVIPQTEGKKPTAAQEERMKKLQEWREAKGISYKRPPLPVKPQVRRTLAVPQPFWTAMKEKDEAHSLICAVDGSLADCIKLLGEGCPPDQVKEVLARMPPVSRKFAKYWICQARLMEQEGDLDVLPMFEEAVRVVLEPVDELRTVVFEILKKKDELKAYAENECDEHQTSAGCSPGSSNSPLVTPKPVKALICGEKGDSSVVKYRITATPGGPPSQQRGPVRVNGQEVRFFTPVRRSVRIQRASLRYPAFLQDHDLCVASYSDMISEEDKDKSQELEGGETSPSVNDTPMYIYRQNEALKDKVFIQLVYDEGV